jgi:hypothetical protein
MSVVGLAKLGDLAKTEAATIGPAAVLTGRDQYLPSRQQRRRREIPQHLDRVIII